MGMSSDWQRVSETEALTENEMREFIIYITSDIKDWPSKTRLVPAIRSHLKKWCEDMGKQWNEDSFDKVVPALFRGIRA